MKALMQFILKQRLKKKLARLELSEKAMLELVLEGKWKKDDKNFLKLFNENKIKINVVKQQLN